ncbi:hypothetical protein LEQ41_02195 [Streptococcus agalactiae]|nr:hypothetical protein [Streptococcus agalactiae]
MANFTIGRRLFFFMSTKKFFKEEEQEWVSVLLLPAMVNLLKVFINQVQ